MNIENAKVVVVLGMHRSGTSVITRGLQALNVDLGEELMPAAQKNNEKGFFEDIEFNRLNIELLEALGRKWDALAPVPDSVFEQDDFEDYRLRAIELLRARIAGQSKPFGLKDPRIAHLLPFWQSVFDRADASVSYVIAIRNPVSIAESLERRDGFEFCKSFYLWLGHIIPAVLKTRGFPRVVVDFELLMQNPQLQLKRIGKALDLPFEQDSAAVKKYADEFLDEALRHAQEKDLRLVPEVPMDVVTAHDLLLAFAKDRANLEAAESMAAFEKMNIRLQDFAPMLAYMSRTETENVRLKQSLTVKEQEIADLEHHVSNLKDMVKERDERIAELDKTIESLEKMLEQLRGEIESIKDSTAWKMILAMNNKLIKYPAVRGLGRKLLSLVKD